METRKQKNKKIRKQNLILFVLLFSYFFILLFALDRTTKLFFIKNPYYSKNLYLFKLNLAINKNIAFSLAVPQTIIFSLIFGILILLLYLLVKYCKKNELNLVFCLILIIIGALSNVIDRLIYGGVIDFIDVSYFTIFNFADIYITTGVVLWLIAEWRLNPHNTTTKL